MSTAESGTNGELFVQLFDSLLLDSRLTIVDAAVYGDLYWRAKRGSKRCTASNQTIGERLGLKQRTIRNHLKTLEDCGYIKRSEVREGLKVVERRIELSTPNTIGMKLPEVTQTCGTDLPEPPARDCPNPRHEMAELKEPIKEHIKELSIGDESPKEVIKEKSKKKDPLDVEVGTVEKIFKGVKYFDYEEPTEEQCIEAMKIMGNRLNPKSIGESYWSDKCNKEWTRSYGKIKIKSWPNDMWSDFKKGYIHTGEKKW